MSPSHLGPPRTQVGVLFTEKQVAMLDRRAVDEGLVASTGRPNRSELVRIMLAFAHANMPDGWRPEGYDMRQQRPRRGDAGR